MERDLTQFVPREGMNVYGSDGDKVGDVDAVERDYFVVRKGFFFPEDHYIPTSAVSTFDDDNIYLAYTKDQVLEQEWTTTPEGNLDPATTGNYEPGSTIQGSTAAAAGTDTVGEADYDADRAADRDVVDEDDVNVKLHEEELVANRRQVDRGDVVINKNVVEEQREIDVPVTEERVEVTRRAVDGDATPDDHAFEEGTIEVPVRGEEVEVEKRARVTEEIDVDKVAEQHTERVGDTVRREEVEVEGEKIDTDTGNGRKSRNASKSRR